MSPISAADTNGKVAPRILVAKHATFLSHLQGVLVAPFAFFMLRLVTKWWVFLGIFISAGICWLLNRNAIAAHLDLEMIMRMCGVIVVIWIISIGLSTYDHFRYGGWELAPERLELVPVRFAQALLSSDFAAAYKLCSPEYRSQIRPPKFKAAVEEIYDPEGSPLKIVSLHEPGRWRLPILAGAVGRLNAVHTPETFGIALVVLAAARPEADITHPWALQVCLVQEDDRVSVSDFDLVQISWNQ